ncbi:ribosomal protein S18-alanine N-acetyltransferase [Chloroflexota bacterium]
MPYSLRLMRKEDITQLTEIDREAFPDMWPPANFHNELQNRLARYMIAYSEDKTVEKPELKVDPGMGFPTLLSRIERLFRRKRRLSLSDKQFIYGFAGFCMMADEAHIMNIAVREPYRRRGIGGLLLISIIELAMELKASFITLEVRASNTIAQKLYTEYGFTPVGVRCGYYTDNREDGILMSTESISSTSFQEHLQWLKEAHSKKWETIIHRIVR